MEEFLRLLYGNVAMKLSVYVYEAEEGGFWAEVEELPGCVSQGDSEEELEANLLEAIDVALEAIVQDYATSLKPRAASEDAPASKWTFEVRSRRLTRSRA